MNIANSHGRTRCDNRAGAGAVGNRFGGGITMDASVVFWNPRFHRCQQFAGYISSTRLIRNRSLQPGTSLENGNHAEQTDVDQHDDRRASIGVT